jgi:hypothetical protein
MKKFIIILTLLFNFSSIKAQIIHDSLSEEVIKNAPYIIEGFISAGSYCNCLSNEFYDEILEVKLTTVIRGDENLRIGESIFLFIPRVGNKDKFIGSIIDPEKGDAARIRWGGCINFACGGQFLTLNKAPIIDKEWVDKKLFVLYPSKTFSSYWQNNPSQGVNEVQNPEITALNWLKFKTKQDWFGIPNKKWTKFSEA